MIKVVKLVQVADLTEYLFSYSQRQKVGLATVVYKTNIVYIGTSHGYILVETSRAANACIKLCSRPVVDLDVFGNTVVVCVEGSSVVYLVDCASLHVLKKIKLNFDCEIVRFVGKDVIVTFGTETVIHSLSVFGVESERMPIEQNSTVNIECSNQLIAVIEKTRLSIWMAVELLFEYNFNANLVGCQWNGTNLCYYCDDVVGLIQVTRQPSKLLPGMKCYSHVLFFAVKWTLQLSECVVNCFWSRKCLIYVLSSGLAVALDVRGKKIVYFNQDSSFPLFKSQSSTFYQPIRSQYWLSFDAVYTLEQPKPLEFISETSSDDDTLRIEKSFMLLDYDYLFDDHVDMKSIREYIAHTLAQGHVTYHPNVLNGINEEEFPLYYVLDVCYRLGNSSLISDELINEWCQGYSADVLFAAFEDVIGKGLVPGTSHVDWLIRWGVSLNQDSVLEQIVINLDPSILNVDYIIKIAVERKMTNLICHIYTVCLDDIMTPCSYLNQEQLVLYSSYMSRGLLYPSGRPIDPCRSLSVFLYIINHQLMNQELGSIIRDWLLQQPIIDDPNPFIQSLSPVFLAECHQVLRMGNAQCFDLVNLLISCNDPNKEHGILVLLKSLSFDKNEWMDRFESKGLWQCAYQLAVEQKLNDKALGYLLKQGGRDPFAFLVSHSVNVDEWFNVLLDIDPARTAFWALVCGQDVVNLIMQGSRDKIKVFIKAAMELFFNQGDLVPEINLTDDNDTESPLSPVIDRDKWMHQDHLTQQEETQLIPWLMNQPLSKAFNLLTTVRTETVLKYLSKHPSLKLFTTVPSRITFLRLLCLIIGRESITRVDSSLKQCRKGVAVTLCSVCGLEGDDVFWHRECSHVTHVGCSVEGECGVCLGMTREGVVDEFELLDEVEKKIK